MKKIVCDECDEEEAEKYCKLCKKELCGRCFEEHLIQEHSDKYNEFFEDL